MYLEKYQQNLRQLDASLGECCYLSEETWSRFIPDSLRTLDLLITSDVEHFTAFLPGLLHIGRRLERLGLELMYQEFAAEIRKQLCSLQSEQSFNQLKDLILQHFDLRDLFHPLSKIIDFARLSAITLSICIGSEGFLHDLKEPLSRQSSLQHFDAPVDQNLYDIIGACSSLKSLHLHAESLWFFERHREAIRLFQTRKFLLHTLSIHSDTPANGKYSIDKEFCAAICRYCPRLKQLGFQVSDSAVDFDLCQQGHCFDEYLVRQS
jgi:hypothetical protein